MAATTKPTRSTRVLSLNHLVGFTASSIPFSSGAAERRATICKCTLTTRVLLLSVANISVDLLPLMLLLLMLVLFKLTRRKTQAAYLFQSISQCV